VKRIAKRLIRPGWLFRFARPNMEFYISGARLSQIENGSTVPSIYKLATLSRIYGVKYARFLRAYGIETDPVPPAAAELEPK
jgi:transcriptional regulator with XRE-family HTH domain